jgi:hypothetical protein
VQQSETFSGAVVPLTGRLLTRTHAGFVAMNDALAQQVVRARGGHPDEVPHGQ